VTFTDEQKNMIKALQESGDMAGAQTIILNELNKEFGGSADAAAKADGGMAQFKAQLGDVGKQIGGALLPAIGQLTSFATTTLMPVLSQFADWFAAKLPIAIGYVTQTVIPAAIQAWQQLQPAIQTAGAIFLQVSGVITAVATTLTNVLSSHADQIQSVLITHWQSIQSSVGSVVGALWSVISAVFSQVQTFLQGNGAQIMSTLSSDWAQIQGAIDAATRAISSIITAILSAVATFIQNHGAQIQAFMQTAWTQISDIVRLAIQLINATIVPALQFIAGFIQAHGAEIQAILGNTWQAITGIIDAALTLIKGVIQIALDLIHGNWQQAWEDLQQMSARIVQDLLQVIGAGLDNLKVLFSGVIDWITHAWDGLVANMQQIGANIIDGIIKGVQNGIGALEDAVSSVAQHALDAAKEALGIHSPSQVMALLVGKPMIEGIVMGIHDAFPLLDSAMNDLGDRVSQALRGVQQLAHDIMKNIIDAGVSTSRQMVSNFDQMGALVKQASDLKDKAVADLTTAQQALDAAIASGDSTKIAEARQKLADANTAYSQANIAFGSAMHTQQEARAALAAAQAQAAEISKTNAQAGADFLALRSKQIFELIGLEQQQRDAQQAGNTGLADALGQKMDLVKQAQDAELVQYQQHADDLAAQMAKQAQDIAKQGTDAGDGFVQGVIAGIAGQTQALSAAMIAAVQGAVDAMRAALGIHSPSLVAARMIGLPLMQGVAAGITGGAPLAAGAMQGAAGAIVQAGQTTNNYYNLSYETRQSTESAGQDIRLLSLLNG
jgi:hypothetical protein